MASFSPAVLATLGGLLLAAAIWDVGARRIPNLVTLLTAVCGLGAQAVAGGVIAALSGLAAGGIVLALLWSQWSKGRLGGGDVKLAAAAAVWVGLHGLPTYVLAGAAAGALVSLVCFAASSRAARSDIALNLKGAALTTSIPAAPLKAAGRVSVPYGVAVAAGALVTLLWR
ncbi:MAG TPA: A24 family peptidase [Polyangia bacterium]|jgi:prepilin peptidase CpaA